MQKIECVADAGLSKGYPTQRAAQVEIETTDGRRHAHFQPTRKGDPEMPLTDEELDDKFLELAVPVIGDAPARTLRDQLWALDTLKNCELACGTKPAARAAL
jgi:2-methylcitrate dehydratase PrpD